MSDILKKAIDPDGLKLMRFKFRIENKYMYDVLKTHFLSVGFTVNGQMALHSGNWIYPDIMRYNPHTQEFNWYGGIHTDVQFNELCDFLVIKFCEYCGETEKQCQCNKEEITAIEAEKLCPVSV